MFSGIGGFSLGLEKTGFFETIAFCEYDEYCRMVLNKNWKLPIIFDVKNLTKTLLDKAIKIHNKLFGTNIKSNQIDLICGGYPCTGHSVAGKKEGFKNEGSNLWLEYFRLVKEINPKYCIIENSPNLRNTGLVEILKAFNSIGYNAEFETISGYSVGAPHQRKRIYIVFWRKDIPYCDPFRWFRTDLEKEKATSGWWSMRRFKRNPLFKQASKIKSKVLQFVDGISEKLDIVKVEEEIKQLGNAVIPQIPELIGRAIGENEQQ